MVDIDKFVASLYKQEEEDLPCGVISEYLERLNKALKEQGLCYKTGEIVEITTKVELPKQVDIDPDIKKIIDEHFDEMLDDENEPKQKPPYGDACKGCKGFEDTGKCYCEGRRGMSKELTEFEMAVGKIDVAKMADEYYDALIKEANMDEHMAGHCRLGYYLGMKDLIKKIKDNSYDTN